MAEHTKIQWATHTWNPVIGCSKVHVGCQTRREATRPSGPRICE